MAVKKKLFLMSIPLAVGFGILGMKLFKKKHKYTDDEVNEFMETKKNGEKFFCLKNKVKDYAVYPIYPNEFNNFANDIRTNARMRKEELEYKRQHKITNGSW